MDALTQIFIWVLASVIASLVAGFYIGRATSHSEQEKLAQLERAKALKALMDVLTSVQQLSSDVDHRNSEMHEVQRQVGDIHVSGELEQIQFLLGHVNVQTTERYLGCKQRLRNAVNDRIGLEPSATE